MNKHLLTDSFIFSLTTLFHGFYFFLFICHKQRNCLKNKERWEKKVEKGKNCPLRENDVTEGNRRERGKTITKMYQIR